MPNREILASPDIDVKAVSIQNLRQRTIALRISDQHPLVVTVIYKGFVSFTLHDLGSCLDHFFCDRPG